MESARWWKLGTLGGVMASRERGAGFLGARSWCGAAAALLLVAGLGLVACGSGSGTQQAADADGAGDVSGDVATEGDSGPVLVPTEARGKVVLPKGGSLSLTDLTVRTGLGDAPVASDGRFTVTVGGSGDSLAMVVDGAGNLVLLGFIDPATETVVDADATAAALVFFALRLYGMPPDVRVEMFRLVKAHPYLGQLGNAVEALSAQDPALLMGDNADLRESLVNLLNLMIHIEVDTSAGTQKAPAEAGADPNNAVITAEPTAPQSGTLVGPNLAGNGMQVTSMSRRAAWYYVYRVGHEGEDGVRVDEPHTLVRDGFVPSTNGITGTVGTLKDALSGSLDFGPRSLASPVPLEVPVGQRRVFFEAVVAGAFIPAFSDDASWYDSGNPLHQQWKTRANLMLTVSFVRDVLFPAVFAIALPIKGAVQGAEDLPTWESLAQLVVSQVPAVTGQLAQGDFDGALKGVLLAMASNYELRNGVALVLLTTLAGEAHAQVDKAMETFMKANFLVAAVDLGLAGVDIGMVVSDLSKARPLERWDVTAIKAKVLLRSSRDPLDPHHLSTTLTATVPAAKPLDYFCFKWTLDGPGELSPFLEGPDTGSVKVAVSGDADMLYLIDKGDLVDGALAVITCEPFANPGGGPCAWPPSGESVGEGRITIRSSKKEDDPCPPEAFNLPWWQTEAGSIGLTASGQYGEEVTVSLNVPEDPHIGGGYRDVHIYIPRPASTDNEAVTISGDHGGASVSEETWIEWFRQDEATGPVWFSKVADISFRAVGAITVSMQTTATPIDCESDQEGAPPCCPHWAYRDPFGQVLIGPIVYAKVSGAGRSITLIRAN